MKELRNINAKAAPSVSGDAEIPTNPHFGLLTFYGGCAHVSGNNSGLRNFSPDWMPAIERSRSPLFKNIQVCVITPKQSI